MKCDFALAFFLLIALALPSEGHTGNQLPVGGQFVNWQIHSWDDLREWSAMLAKGAQWLKIDMHYMDSSFCISQGIHNAEGCFVLLHDTPLKTVIYNTSDDVVSYIRGHPQYFNNPNKKMYIALCFKSTPFDICGASGQGFLSRLTSFKSSVDLLVSQGANVEFVIDGSLDMTQVCTKNAFRPWPSTWQGPPYEAFFSNDSSRGYDRLQVFDLPDNSLLISTAAKANWGKFEKMKWPLLVWEPADEASIQKLTSIYLNWALLQPEPTNLPDYRFAINIDPIQFQIYSSSATKRTWRALFSDLPDPRPKITALPASTTTFLPLPINAVLFQQSEGNLVYSFIGSSDIQGQPDSTTEGRILAPNTLLNSVSSKALSINSKPAWLVLTSDWNSELTLYSADIFNGTLNALFQSRHTHPFYSVSSFALAAPEQPVLSHSIVTTLSYADPTSLCSGWQLKFLNVSIRPAIPQSGPIASACLNDFSLPPLPAQASGSISAIQTAPNTVEGVMTSSSGGVVSASYFVAEFSSFINSVSVSKPVVLGVGANSSLSATWSEDVGPLVLEVHGDGFCWNTEERNKQPTPLVCDQVPTSTPGVLNYNYAPLENWKSFLTSPSSAPMSSCSSLILHGTFDQGSNPSAALVSLGSQSAVIEAHHGWKASDKDTSQCGAPISRTPFGGAMLNSWIPPNW
jgi:hypothetical protein